MKKIGIADTMFSRFDYFPVIKEALEKSGKDVEYERYTVPGVKDLPVACKRLFSSDCDIIIACGMVGKTDIDEQCAHEASTSIQAVQLSEGKHILEVFVHLRESDTEKEIVDICRNRVYKHTHNALMLLFDQEGMQKRAGTGIRQGKEDEGPFMV